jgi:hypothetical protein
LSELGLYDLRKDLNTTDQLSLVKLKSKEEELLYHTEIFKYTLGLLVENNFQVYLMPILQGRRF